MKQITIPLAICALVIGVFEIPQKVFAGEDGSNSGREVDMDAANRGAEHIEHERSQEEMRRYQNEAGSRHDPDREVGGGNRVGIGSGSSQPNAGVHVGHDSP